MSDLPDEYAPDTRAIHADRDANETRAVTAPIWQTSTFWADSSEEFLHQAATPMTDHFYTRSGNPNLSQAATVVAALEGAESAVLAASGMGAITSTVLAFVSAGEHVVAQEGLYPGTSSFLRNLAPRLGIETTLVDQRDPDAFASAVRDTTRLIILETPSNPLLHITDLAAVTAMARSRGILTMADNTFATPVNQRPIALGADLAVHSATKYMGGHSDLIAGVVAGRRAHVERVWRVMAEMGASLGPFDAWLMLRGLRTLPLRMERHNANGQAVANWLAQHPAVCRVNYPGLPSHPQHALAARQMSGFGGMLSVELHGGYAAAGRFVDEVRMARRAASLGGVETLVAHPAAMWAKTLTADQMAEVGLSPGLVRLSIGLENERDVIADFDRALERVAAAGA